MDNQTNNNNNNWHRSPPKHRHTVDKINISNYRTGTSDNNNNTDNFSNKRQKREDSKTYQQEDIQEEISKNDNNANDENEKKEKQKKENNEGRNTQLGMVTLQHCMARLADLAKGYGSISLVCNLNRVVFLFKLLNMLVDI